MRLWKLTLELFQNNNKLDNNKNSSHEDKQQIFFNCLQDIAES